MAFSLIPTVFQQMEEIMRCELACLSHVYLAVHLWTNRNMTCILGITVHFIDAKRKLRTLVLVANPFQVNIQRVTLPSLMTTLQKSSN